MSTSRPLLVTSARAITVVGAVLGVILVVTGEPLGWGVLLGVVSGLLIGWAVGRLGPEHRRVALTVAMVGGAVVGLLATSVLGPPSLSGSTEIHGVPVVRTQLRHYPAKGQVTDQICLVERNYGKYHGSCQDHYSTSVSDLARACHSCGGRDTLPCNFHPGVVCTALLHADLYSWGLTYSIHEEVRAYFDGYHIWARRSYKGWKGWQRCWSGYAAGVTVTNENCGSRYFYRQNGSARIQATDWVYDFKVSLFAGWFPFSKDWEVNMRHWPYPGASEIWVA